MEPPISPMPAPDFDINAVVPMLAGGKALPAHWRPWIRGLTFRAPNLLNDLSPLRELTALSYLSLKDSPVEDISPLSALSELGMLFLDNTGVRDLMPLAGLLKLEELSIAGTAIETLAPLSRSPSLKIVFVESDERARALERTLGTASRAHIRALGGS